jgi:hypothetical protein
MRMALQKSMPTSTKTHSAKALTEMTNPGRQYKAIYEAILAKLDAETGHRKGRAVEAWIIAERECVTREINRQRALLAYAPLEIAVVERAERQAVGHSDYVSKYAHVAADLALCEKPFE